MTGLRIVIHAPTAAALARARSNARNLRKADPEAEFEIVVNAAGAPAALAEPDAETDDCLRICANSLASQGLEAPPSVRTIAAAVVHIARRQAEGWAYLRA